MGKTKEMFMKMNYEESAMEFYARLQLLRDSQEDLIDPEVSPEMKRIILKAALG